MLSVVPTSISFVANEVHIGLSVLMLISHNHADSGGPSTSCSAVVGWHCATSTLLSCTVISTTRSLELESDPLLPLLTRRHSHHARPTADFGFSLQ